MSNAERASADSSSHEEEEIEYDSIDIEKASSSSDPDIPGEAPQTERPNDALQRTISSRTDTSTGKNIIAFETNDPDNPYNWSQTKKTIIVLACIITVLNSTLGSSIPSGDLPKISQKFGVENDDAQLVLPNSMYLAGYVVGPLLFAPLSESYGRQIIMISTFGAYFIFSLVLCFAPNWAAFISFRAFQGVFACSPISVTGGLYADLYAGPVARGRSMAIFMAATVWGPLIGPVASGYLQVYSWQWPFLFVLIFAGVSLVPVCFLPETYGPVILQRRARKLRKQDPDSNIWAQLDIDTSTWRDIFVTFLGRPFRMLFTEPLVSFSCLFLSLVYGIFYMLLIAFPQIFPPVYGFSLGEQGLAFLGIGIGSFISCGIYLWYDRHLRLAKVANKSWASDREEYRRLPLACIGGPFFAISLFWIGWSAQPSVHYIVPILGGVPLGIGYLLLFMALLNYVVDAYEIFAASALAALSCSRALFGTVLPFATTPMYQRLGVQWACSLLGFISLAMCAIPFVFVRYGERIRGRSKFCKELAELRRKRSARDARRRRRMERAAAEANANVVVVGDKK